MENFQGKEWVFIINPVAGNGFARRFVPELKAALQEYQVDAELVYTTGKGHASELAGDYASRGFKYIIGVGGDGMLDVCSIKELSLLQRLNLLMKVPGGTHIYNQRVHYYQTDRIILEFPAEVPFHVDGELNFSSRFEVGISPDALRTIYNPNGKHFFKN